MTEPTLTVLGERTQKQADGEREKIATLVSEREELGAVLGALPETSRARKPIQKDFDRMGRRIMDAEKRLSTLTRTPEAVAADQDALAEIMAPTLGARFERVPKDADVGTVVFRAQGDGASVLVTMRPEAGTLVKVRVSGRDNKRAAICEALSEALAGIAGTAKD